MIRRRFVTWATLSLGLAGNSRNSTAATEFASVIKGVVFGFGGDQIEPLDGARVTAYGGKGGEISTTTGGGGEFSLNVGNREPVILVFKANGYGSGTCVSVGASAKLDAAVVHITLVKGGQDTSTLKMLKKLLDD
jgi:hypothetical protein